MASEPFAPSAHRAAEGLLLCGSVGLLVGPSVFICEPLRRRRVPPSARGILGLHLALPEGVANMCEVFNQARRCSYGEKSI